MERLWPHGFRQSNRGGVEVLSTDCGPLDASPRLTTAGFSRMAAGTHIKPHIGWVQTVYRLHMGLVVPPDCALRVGSETRSWREGECLVFDDTVGHAAWTRATKTRVLLLLDWLRR